MDHREYSAAAANAIRQMAHDVAALDPSTPVPTCPGWDVRRLVVHVGSIHRWVAALVAAAAPVRPPRSEDVELADADVAPWLAAGAELIAGLVDADPDTPMWAWGSDKHVRFWPRRMLHETTVHHGDVLLAAGREPAFAAVVAIDGVDELLDNLPHAAYFAPGVAELKGEGSIHLHCTDSDPGAAGEWTIVLGPEGFSWTHAHSKATAAVRGTATDLLLLAYGRRSLEDRRFETFGEVDLVRHWLAHSAI